jgi:hypothetical protein
MHDLVIEVPGIQEISSKLTGITAKFDTLIASVSCLPDKLTGKSEIIAPPHTFAWLRLFTQLNTLTLDQTGDLHPKEFKQNQDALLKLLHLRQPWCAQHAEVLTERICEVTKPFEHKGISIAAKNERTLRFQQIYALQFDLLNDYLPLSVQATDQSELAMELVTKPVPEMVTDASQSSQVESRKSNDKRGFKP